MTRTWIGFIAMAAGAAIVLLSGASHPNQTLAFTGVIIAAASLGWLSNELARDLTQRRKDRTP